MTIEELLNTVQRKQAEFDFELSRCTDAYRAKYMLKKYNDEMKVLIDEASEMVRELEGLDNERI